MLWCVPSRPWLSLSAHKWCTQGGCACCSDCRQGHLYCCLLAECSRPTCFLIVPTRLRVSWTWNHATGVVVYTTILSTVWRGMYMREDSSAHRKSRAPLGRGQCILYGIGVCIRVRKVYRPIAAWSDCSVNFTEHVHVRMETAQRDIEARSFITYTNPDPDPVRARIRVKGHV